MKESKGKPMDEHQSLLASAKEKEAAAQAVSFGRSACFCIFGVTSFVLSNALWVELPLIYREAPEGPKVAAYLILSLQLANVVPAIYVMQSRERQQRSLVGVIYALLSVGIAVSCLMAAFHSVTTTINGQARSIALFSLAFLSACVSDTTNVTYFPFVARYPKAYTTALLTGEGLSGLVAGVCGILQNSGGAEPRFSVRAYFLFVAAVFATGLVAFTVIVSGDGSSSSSSGSSGASAAADVEIAAAEAVAREAADYRAARGGQDGKGNGAAVRDSQWRKVLPLLLQQALFGSLAYGMIPSISPIMVLGYANPARALMWANILGMVADPLARALTGLVEFYGFWLLTPSGMALAAVLIACASLAPTPPLWDHAWGFTLPVACYTGFQFLTGYTMAMSFLAIRKTVGDKDAEAAYRWGGFGIQAGAFTGTMVGFVLVIVCNAFYTGYR